MSNLVAKASQNEFLASSNTGSQNYINIHHLHHSPCYITMAHCSVQSDPMKGWSQKNCADQCRHFTTALTGITSDKVFWMPKNSTVTSHWKIFRSLPSCMHCNQCEKGCAFEAARDLSLCPTPSSAYFLWSFSMFSLTATVLFSNIPSLERRCWPVRTRSSHIAFTMSLHLPVHDVITPPAYRLPCRV